MKYIDLHDFGSASQLFIADGPKPQCLAGEILIEVVAAGVNRPDIVQRQGLYPAPAGASSILGLEVAGCVAAVGENVSGWNVGDRVCALTNGGGYAEYVAVPASQCLPVPDNLSLTEAAAIPETFFTVWTNVFMRAELQAGDIFLVHGGASGIGSAAIQLAKAFGAKVIATVGSEAKRQACLQLGADHAINYQQQDFVEAVAEYTNGLGADVILDMVGGDYLRRNIKAAAMDGRIVNIAFMAGSKVEINMMPVMMKRLSLTGSTLRAQSASAKAAIATALQQHVWPKLSSSDIAPVIHATYPLEHVAEAHQLMESGEHIGKIILKINEF